jgi:hypothetical protein
MTIDYKIVVLICYYGRFPWYFRYFLQSCQFNPTIDFIIFTDTSYEYELPGNVSFVKKSLDEIKILATQKIGTHINIDNPYKLCEYKPAFGLLFSEYIKGYDFWAQSDIDVIYGDIRGFMTDQLLSTCDFVSCRTEWTTGCFTLFRNNELMNNIFKRGKDCEKIFADSKYWGFDEFNFLHTEINDETTVWDIKTEIETFTHIIKAAERDKEIVAQFDFIQLEGVPGKIKFDNGKVIYKNTFEAMLYHLFWLKRVYNPSYVPRKLPKKYFISRTRIYY